MAFIPSLFRIQEIENRLLLLKQSEIKVEQESNLSALLQLIEKAKKALADTKFGLTQNRTATKQLELELNSCLDHFKTEESKLYGGKIFNPRELEQIQQKMVEYKSTQTIIEEKILSLLEKDEMFSKEVFNLEKRLQNCDVEKEKLKSDIQQKKFTIQIEKEELQLELETLIPLIPQNWMERYRRIAGSHRGIGIAKVKNNACGACHVSLSESKLQELKRGDDQMKFCENCGRIICY